jgi:hypothetical protein
MIDMYMTFHDYKIVLLDMLSLDVCIDKKTFSK